MNRTTDSFAFDCAGWEGPVADISADQGTLSEDDDQEILNVSPFFHLGSPRSGYTQKLYKRCYNGWEFKNFHICRIE